MKALLTLLFFILLLSCSSDDQLSGDVEIRIKNTSLIDFNDVLVNTKEFGDIDAGEFSSYQPFELAYRYDYIELKSDGETYILQPIDFVGETPLSPGQYTYQLDILDLSGSPYIQLTFIED